MIILDLPHSWWSKSHEDKAADGELTVCTEWAYTLESAEAGQKTAKMYGRPIYVWENGKVVAKKL